MGDVLITGASGLIGSAAARALAEGGYTVHAGFHAHPGRVPQHEQSIHPRRIDLVDVATVGQEVLQVRPSTVVHLGAMSELGSCERNPERAMRVNVESTRAIAEACRACGAVLIFASTDQVFDGATGGYHEHDDPRPINVYGRTKLAAEHHVAALRSRGIVLRIALVYGSGPTGSRSATEQIISACARGESPRLFTDEFRSPILVDDVAAALVELADRLTTGDPALSALESRIVHLGGPDRVSRHEFGQHVAEAFHLDPCGFTAARQRDVDLAAPRPADVSLDTSLARQVLRTKLRGIRQGLADMACMNIAAHAPGNNTHG